MSASVAINWMTTGQVIPAHFAFVDIENYDNEVLPNTTLRDKIFGLGAEGHRIIAHITDPGTVASPQTAWMNRLNAIKDQHDRAIAAGRTIGVGFGAFSGPPGAPSSHADPRGAGEVASSGSRSPLEAKNWLDYMKNTLGLNVEWMEVFNEPGTQGDAWYDANVAGYAAGDLATPSGDWCAVHARQFFDPIIAAPALHAGTRLCLGSQPGPYDGEMLKHMVGVGYISSSLLTDSSLLHADSWSDHTGYGSGAIRNTTDGPHRQSLLNATCDPTWNDGNTLKAGWRGTLLRARQLLDSNGGSTKTIDDTEWQPDGNWTMPYAMNWMRGIMQSVQFIQAFNLIDVLKLRSKTVMSAVLDDHVSPAYGGGLILGTETGGTGVSALTYTVAAANLSQQIFPYSRKYKQQVQSIISANPATPGGSLTNPVSSIYCAAGIDGAGKGGILVCNIDLTNQQVVTFNLSQAPTQAIQRTRMLQTDVNGTPLAVSSLPSNNTFSVTLEPGEVSLLEFTGVGSGAVGGTTYYVSAAGSNVNDGLSTATPKLTIAAALTLAVGGDQILLRRGDNFSENIFLGSSKSGTVTRSTRFGSYGTTAGNSKAKITAPSPSTTAPLTFDGCSYIEFDDIEITNNNFTDANNSANAVTGEHIIETGAQAQHITFKRCYLHHSANCIIQSNNGLTPRSSLGNGVGTGDDNDWYFEDCEFYASGNSLIIAHGTHWVWRRCHFHRWGESSYSPGKHAVYCHSVNAVFDQCVMHNNDAQVGTHSGPTQGSPMSIRVTGVIVQDCLIHDTNGPAIFWYDNVAGVTLFLRNRWYNCHGFAFYFVSGDDTGPAYHFGPNPVDKVIFANNVIHILDFDSAAAIDLSDAATAQYLGGLVLVNNIIIGPFTYAINDSVAFVANNGITGKLLEKNNLWIATGTSTAGTFRWNSTNRTLAQWQAAGVLSGNVQGVGSFYTGTPNLGLAPAGDARRAPTPYMNIGVLQTPADNTLVGSTFGAPDYFPAGGSPVVDAGSPSVDTVITYNGS